MILTNQVGSVTSSNAILSVTYPPSITAQPASLLVLPGTNIAFGFSLNGTAPFTYIWRFNGTNILNATNADLCHFPGCDQQRRQLFRGDHQPGGRHDEFCRRVDRAFVAHESDQKRQQ